MIISIDENQAGLIWMAASSKAEWMNKNNWPPIQSGKMKSWNLNPTEEQTYHQAIGLAGEAAVHLWIFGNLSRFFIQQQINNDGTKGDGGEDIPGVNIKAVDSLCNEPLKQMMMIPPSRISSDIIYLQTMVIINNPYEFIYNLRVQIIGAISGASIMNNFKIDHAPIPCYQIPFDLLYPPEALLWDEQKRKIK